MKTLKRSLLLLGLGLVLTSSAQAKKISSLKMTNGNDIHLDVAQFGKYLQDGNPHAAEGVYRTKDKRYTIAIVKNDEKSHDFIGVVLSADNTYWNEGQVKFNFVLNEKNELEGLYYNSVGEAFPVQMILDESGIDNPMLEKVEVNELRNQGIASLVSISNQ